MAVGTITSPLSWLLGGVVAPAWLQNVQDSLNNVFSYKSKSRNLWITPECMESPLGKWVYTSGTPSWFQSTASTDKLYIPCPTFYTDSGTQYQKLTAVYVKMNGGGAFGATCSVQRITSMGTTSTPTSSDVAFALAGGAGHQTVAITGLTELVSDTQAISIRVDAGQANDRVYGVRFVFDNSTIVSP